MSIKVGDKFIIEIGEKFVGAESMQARYRIKGFDSLVFDKKGLDKLEPVEKAWENELEKAQSDAYNKGYENGKKEPREVANVEDTNEYQISYKTGFEVCTNLHKLTAQEWENELSQAKEDGYNKGVEDSENLFVHEYDYEQFFEDTYGSKDPDYNLYDLVAKYGAKKVLDDFQKWQEEKKKAEDIIKEGDIVRFNEKCHNYNAVKGREYLVLHVFENELVTLLYDNGDTGAADTSLLDKTNRHIEEVSQLLDKLRGERNDR